MQLQNLVRTLDSMSDDELLERLRIVRHSREVGRPTARKRDAPERKASKARVSATTKLLDGLSDEERQALIERLSKE